MSVFVRAKNSFYDNSNNFPHFSSPLPPLIFFFQKKTLRKSSFYVSLGNFPREGKFEKKNKKKQTSYMACHLSKGHLISLFFL